MLAVLALALAACGTGGDDTTDGTRGQCAEGGALSACPEAERTPEGACWRLVDCGAIPLASDNTGVFDWGACVDGLERATADRERLAIDCIAASTCDALKTSGDPRRPDPSQMYCLRLGGL